MEKSALYWDGYKSGLEKVGFKHPFKETGDFRDALPEEWAEHQKTRSNRAVKNLGTVPGALGGGALGFLSTLKSQKPVIRGGGVLGGALLGGLLSRMLFGKLNEMEAANISPSQWAQGFKRYNAQWEKENL